MMNLWKYIKKVWKNENHVYDQVSSTLHELGWFLATLIASVLLLAIPAGRVVLKWIAYLTVGSIGMIVCLMTVSDIVYLTKNYRKHRRMQESGFSEEEAEEARIRLCKMEGDDGLSPEDFADACRKTVYFMDCSAMSSYANSLYGCFLAQRFDPRYMKLENDAIFYTTQKELDKLQEAETSQNIPGAPYPGYTSFIRVYVRLVPEVPREQLICERENGLADTPTTDDEMNVAFALYLQNAENVGVIMVSESEEVHELAEYNRMMSKKPFAEG